MPVSPARSILFATVLAIGDIIRVDNDIYVVASINDGWIDANEKLCDGSLSHQFAWLWLDEFPMAEMIP